MRPKPKPQAVIVGVVPYSSTLPTFALPILRESEDGPLLVQDIDPLTENVVGFLSFSDTDVTLIEVSPSSITLGAERRLAFLDRDGVVTVGSLSGIKPVLEHEVVRSDPEIALQIVELIGSASAKTEQRRAVRQAISTEVGESAGRSYEKSALRLLLWDRVVKSARDETSAREALAKRSLIDVLIADDGKVSVDLSSLNLQDFPALDLDSLIEELSAEFETDTSSAPTADEVRGQGISTEITGQTLKRFLDHRLRRDGRIAGWNYNFTAERLKRLGFNSIEEVARAVAPYNGDLLSYVASSTRQGQIRKLELMLAAHFGDRPPDVYPFNTVWMARYVERFKNADIPLGADPLPIEKAGLPLFE